MFTCDGVSQSVCRQLLESLLISEEPVHVLVNNGGLWGPGLGTGGWPLQTTVWRVLWRVVSTSYALLCPLSKAPNP